MRNSPLKGILNAISPIKHALRDFTHPHPHEKSDDDIAKDYFAAGHPKTKKTNIYSGKKSFSTAETKTGKKK